MKTINIQEFIDSLRDDCPDLNANDLFDYVRDNEKRLIKLCLATMKTYREIEQAKKELENIQKLLN